MMAALEKQSLQDAGIFDVAVIGGGINGVGIARDAAGRGAKVLLLERGDLASGTSSASTKLIHGGLRYLEHYAFGLVRESLQERETLWRAAPHLIQPLRFVIPEVAGGRPRWIVRLGLYLYDHLGGRNDLPPARSIKLHDHVAGEALKTRGRKGFEYSDCWCDDSRLVIANARDAEGRGATILPHHELAGAARDGNLWILKAGGRTFRSRALVNAAGPQLAIVNERLERRQALPIRLVRGSHIIVPSLFHHPFAYLFQNRDGRIVFAIPYEGAFTLIGTTDVDEDDAAAKPHASDAEIEYLLDAANQQFSSKIERGDIAATYSGVRPLASDVEGRPENASRGYRLEISDPEEGAALLTVIDGKLTTYRHLGERAVDLLSKRLEAFSEGHWTGDAALPGGQFEHQSLSREIEALASRYPFLGQKAATRIFKAYGTEASEWLAKAKSWGDLGTAFGGCLSEAEVRWMVEQEFAASSEDILWRRSKLGLHMTRDGKERLAAHLGEKAA